MTYTISYRTTDPERTGFAHFFNVPKEDVGAVVTTLCRERRATIYVTLSRDPYPGKLGEGVFERGKSPGGAKFPPLEVQK